ncbi:MAG: NAD-dependent epimerase/dehydratase family protein [Elusimicrobiota bacterium]
MKVFVTGGAGFIGSHVCEFYAKRGDSVLAYDNLTKHELLRTGYGVESSRSYNVDVLKDLGVKLLRADVRDRERVLDSASGCDFIVHTAAQPAMTIGMEAPGLDFDTNALGTFNVLEAARRLKIPAVTCSTIHVYGNRINESLTEEQTRYTRSPAEIDETFPIEQGLMTPLHASKLAGELYVRTYIDTYGVQAAAFRLTGLYGPRQFGGEDHGWVANFAIRAVLGKPLTVYGTGKQVRDILYASDVVEAFHAFYTHRRSGIFVIGGGRPNAISLLECIQLLAGALKVDPRIEFGPERRGDLRYFVCDSAKARRELDWTPRVGVREGLSRLVAWVKENTEVFQAP